MAFLYKRSKTWWAGYYIKGKRYSKRIGVVPEKRARQILKNIEYALVNQRWETLLPKDPKNPPSVEDFCRRYQEYYSTGKSPKSVIRDRSIISSFLAFCKENNVETLDQISTPFLSNYKKHVIEQTSNANFNRYFNTINAMLNIAVKEALIASNPARNISKAKVQDKIPKYLSEEQLDTLLKAAKGHYLFPLIATARYAGLRRAELINLEWDDIEEDFIYVRNKKGGRTVKNLRDRTVPLNSKLKAILNTTPKILNYCFIFEGRKLIDASVTRAFARIAKKARIDCTLKDLRESFGSILAQRGVSIYKISEWMGHSSIDVTRRHYAHLAKADKDIDLI